MQLTRFTLTLLTLALTSTGATAAGTDTGPDTSLQSPRIVGGTDAARKDYPFIASLQFRLGAGKPNDRHYCGGSLISPSWILTAAHCVEDVEAADLSVLVGGHDLSKPRQGVRRRVKAIHVSPDYTGEANDVALLRLDRPVTTLAPVQLAGTAGTTYEQVQALMRVIGWGSTAASPGGGPATRPSLLQQVDVPFVPHATCRELYSTFPLDADAELCAGTTGLDSCQGDSGGPLFVQDDGKRWVQLGVVSWGRGCAAPDSPGVYARLAGERIDAFLKATWTGD